MNKENNGYVILYASVMVILVAVGLAFTSQSLKDRQIDNQNIDKMEQILRSLGISGGTLTSKGVNNMLLDVLTQYEPFLNNLKQQNN